MLYGRIYPRHIRGETPASPTSGTPESTARPYYMTWLLNFVRWSICMRVTASKGLQHRPTHGAGLGGGGAKLLWPTTFYHTVWSRRLVIYCAECDLSRSKAMGVRRRVPKCGSARAQIPGEGRGWPLNTPHTRVSMASLIDVGQKR